MHLLPSPWQWLYALPAKILDCLGNKSGKGVLPLCPALNGHLVRGCVVENKMGSAGPRFDLQILLSSCHIHLCYLCLHVHTHTHTALWSSSSVFVCMHVYEINNVEKGRPKAFTSQFLYAFPMFLWFSNPTFTYLHERFGLGRWKRQFYLNIRWLSFNLTWPQSKWELRKLFCVCGLLCSPLGY